MQRQYPYQVYNAAGVLAMESPECCRYDKATELAMLEVGFTIRLYGKRLSKADIRREVPCANNGNKPLRNA